MPADVTNPLNKPFSANHTRVSELKARRVPTRRAARRLLDNPLYQRFTQGEDVGGRLLAEWDGMTGGGDDMNLAIVRHMIRTRDMRQLEWALKSLARHGKIVGPKPLRIAKHACARDAGDHAGGTTGCATGARTGPPNPCTPVGRNARTAAAGAGGTKAACATSAVAKRRAGNV